MSVLFEALNKAAREYRRQKAPVIVPLLSLSPAVRLKRRAVFVVLLFFCFSGLVGVLAFSDSRDAAAKDKTVAGVVGVEGKAQSPTRDVSFPKTSHQVAAEESLGIALDVSGEEAGEAAPRTETPKGRHEEASRSGMMVAVLKKTEGEKGEAGGLLAQAQRAASQGAWDKALGLYDRLLKDNKKDQAALEGKVLVLGHRGADEDLDALDLIVESHPSLAAAHAARARILVRQKDTLEALAAWRQAVALEPQNKDYRLGLAILSDTLGRRAEALALYRAVPEPLPEKARRRLDYLAAHEHEEDGAQETSPSDDE